MSENLLAWYIGSDTPDPALWRTAAQAAADRDNDDR